LQFVVISAIILRFDADLLLEHFIGGMSVWPVSFLAIGMSELFLWSDVLLFLPFLVS
jgi:hypothetical protein